MEAKDFTSFDKYDTIFKYENFRKKIFKYKQHKLLKKLLSDRFIYKKNAANAAFFY